MTSLGRLTTINVHESTVRVLKGLMDGKRRSYEDVILALIDANPPAAYLKELERRLREEKSIPAEQVYREAGLR
jgi:hypothetical protein